MYRILCFGDSLTYGVEPISDERLSSRWTKVLAHELGSQFEVIEEGLGGRTMGSDDLLDPTTNGLKYFPACVRSHLPFDLLILWLGTNDLKKQYILTPAQITDNLEKYFSILLAAATEYEAIVPKVLVLSPPKLNYSLIPPLWGFPCQDTTRHELISLYREMCKKYDAQFLDTSDIISTGRDGIHLEESENIKFGKYLASFVKKF